MRPLTPEPKVRLRVFLMLYGPSRHAMGEKIGKLA